jgi:hypothetical protein
VCLRFYSGCDVLYGAAGRTQHKNMYCARKEKEEQPLVWMTGIYLDSGLNSKNRSILRTKKLCFRSVTAVVAFAVPKLSFWYI